MKRMLRRSWLIFIVVLAFFVGLGFLIFQTIYNASEWATKPYNLHTSGAGGLSNAGDVLDRDGEVLAKTVDGERVYHEDEAVRKSLLHTVGDNSINISTALQSQKDFRSTLTGYSFLWGINLPESFKKLEDGGKDITLTVDADTCKVAYNSLKNYDSGACVIYNYKTGEILCSVSVKSYDPQAPPKITEENIEEYEGVYLNNVLSSTYTPGSIFKIVTAACAIENIPDIWERTWDCNGKVEFVGNDISCDNSKAHGHINLEQAFAKSCNVVFAELAVELGQEKMTETAKALGVDSSFDINGINTKKGNYNVNKTDDNLLAWSGVGQYTDEVNPMQMAILCGAIANEGEANIPYLIKKGMFATTKQESLLSKETADSLKDLMRYAVENSYGTSMFGDLTVCAKTGTAETSKGDKEENNGWMVGFSTDEDCPLAFACVVSGTENYGYGTAGQVAKEAMIQAAKSIRK